MLISNDHLYIIKKIIQEYYILGKVQEKLSHNGYKKEAEEMDALTEDSLSVLD